MRKKYFWDLKMKMIPSRVLYIKPIKKCPSYRSLKGTLFLHYNAWRMLKEYKRDETHSEWRPQWHLLQNIPIIQCIGTSNAKCAWLHCWVTRQLFHFRMYHLIFIRWIVKLGRWDVEGIVQLLTIKDQLYCVMWILACIELW